MITPPTDATMSNDDIVMWVVDLLDPRTNKTTTTTYETTNITQNENH
jgi:hypothetical protein